MASPKRAELRALATKILAKPDNEPGVAETVQALLNSVGDTLSDRAIYEELLAIDKSASAFVEVFASTNKHERP